jgi:hypothetical protein
VAKGCSVELNRGNNNNNKNNNWHQEEIQKLDRKISNWRKELSILAESGPGPDNFKLNIKKRTFFRNTK